jgi:molybdenum cofactor cytidylyltransferase
MAELPLLLLAAGASRRMGQPKQLLPWGKITLIEHQIQTLLRTGNPVMVVLGYLEEQIAPLLKPYPVLPLNHQQWGRGMGSSIAFGIRELEKEFPDAEGALIAQLDQPLVSESHFRAMLGHFRAGAEQIIVTRSASGWEGVPVLFDKQYFTSLLELDGEEGARKIFRHHSRSVTYIESRDVVEDMDTPESYEKILALYLRGSGSQAR